MILPRREFLRLVGVAAGAAGVSGCGPRWSVPDDLVAMALRGPGLDTEVQTVCGLCGAGCGLSVRLVDGLPVGLKGNPHHPLNRGGLCPVGHAGLELLYAPNRLRGPSRRGPDGELVDTTWDEALGRIGARMGELRAAGQGAGIVVLHDEPGALFDDFARRFAAAVGSPNIARPRDPVAAAYRLTQGTDTAPAFDLRETDLVLSFGLDLYEDGPAPLHAIASMIGGRATEDRASTIHIGTRLSPSAAKAEEWVGVRPGTHSAFALGVAHVLVREGHYDREFVARHTFGFEDWTDDDQRRRLGFRRLLMERYYPDRAAMLCGVEAAAIVRVARRFAESPAAVAVVGGEAVQGSNGTWTVMAVQALNALMGAFGRPGGVTLPPPIPFAPLPDLREPRATEQGSMFAAPPTRSLGEPDPVEALADAVLEGSADVEILLVAGFDPVHDSPAGDRLRRAMNEIPLVVSLATFPDETSRWADYVLPTSLFLERWQGTTTPATVAFSTVGVAGPVVEPFYDTRHPGDVLLEMGKLAEVSADALPWDDYADYLHERINGLTVSRQGAIITGSFEESWTRFLEERGWRFPESQRPDDYWQELVRQAGWWNPVRPDDDWRRLFGATDRYEFCSRPLEQLLRRRGAAGGAGDDDDTLARGIEALGIDVDVDLVCLPHFEPPTFAGDGDVVLQPFRPTTSRGSLGANSRMVLEMFGYTVLSGWRAWAELSPETATELAVGDGDLVAVEGNNGVVEAVVHVYPGSVAGVVHLPLGLGYGEPDDGRAKNPVEVLATNRDPLSGSLLLGATRVRLRVLQRRARGLPAPGHGRTTP